MDWNRSLLEAELKALMEVSTDFARGLSTVAARMKVLKSCLDKPKPHDGRTSRVDRATSPMVFRTDRSTSVSPLRFKSPVKFKEESVDIHEETVTTDVPEERNYCDIKINQEQSISGNNGENSFSYSQKRTGVVRHEIQSMEVSCDATSSSDNDVPTTFTNQIITMPVESSLTNLRKSYYVVNPVNGLAIPIDVSQIKELGLSKNPVQQITVQHNQPIEEDILYAMQANQNNRSIDACSTVATVGTVGQEIILSSEGEHEPAISERVFASRFVLPNRNRGIRKKTLTEKREYNRLRQAKYRAAHAQRWKDKCANESKIARNMANNINSTLNSDVNNDGNEVATHNVLILRKELIKKTYARGRTEAS